MHNSIPAFVFFAALVLVLGVVGKADFEDEVAQELRTCEMVKAGAWPAEYARSKNIDCSASLEKPSAGLLASKTPEFIFN